MGVSVSDTMPGHEDGGHDDHRELVQQPPTTPPMNSTGMNTAASDTVIDMIVKPISRAPLSAASMRPMPASMWRTMFSSMTMASSTTNPTQSVSAISEMMSIV